MKLMAVLFVPFFLQPLRILAVDARVSKRLPGDHCEIQGLRPERLSLWI